MKKMIFFAMLLSLSLVPAMTMAAQTAAINAAAEKPQAEPQAKTAPAKIPAKPADAQAANEPDAELRAEQRAAQMAQMAATKEFNDSVKQARKDLRSKWHELQFQIYAQTPDEKRVALLITEITALNGVILKAKIEMQRKLIKAGIPLDDQQPEELFGRFPRGRK